MHGPSPPSSWSLSGAAKLWRRAPVPGALRRGLAQHIGVGVDWVEKITPQPAARPATRIAPGGLVVSGFLSDVLGIGSAGRRTVEALRRANLNPTVEDIGFLRDQPLYERRALPGPPGGGVWVSLCNPPELDRLLFAHRGTDIKQRYRIGCWAWELEAAPRQWARTARGMNEIWAPSRFVQDAIRRVVAPSRRDIVKVVPHPAQDMSAVRGNRPRFGLAADAMVVLVMADMRSTSARKNPIGAIEAYLRAFPQPTPHTQLVCKIVAHQAAPDDYAKLSARLAGRSDITLITDELSDQDIWSLIASCDVLLSLHRSEGYGLALAEAMRLGRCAVATAWSGNMDFMNDACSVLVPFTLLPVDASAGPYANGLRWAEPDVDFAARALRDLLAHPEHRTRMGDLATRHIDQHEATFYGSIVRAPWRALLTDP